MNYYASIADNYKGYMKEHPKKQEVLNNAKVKGNVSILPNSGNRAIIIDTNKKEYLQSYDTLIIEIDKETGEAKKLWDGYSATTMKHIGSYLQGKGSKWLSKKEWMAWNKGETRSIA